ncbi:MAG: hypothetical protein ACTHKF_03040 [Candidatus Nitrosocosmicus sp.]
MYHYVNSNEHKIQFENAFDKLQEQKRKFFGIPEVDSLLNFSDRKNICIVNRTGKDNNLLYSFIAKFCVDFCFDNDITKGNIQNNKTILIDAGSGNNLGHIYLHLVNRSLEEEFNIHKVLDNTIIARAFTFYQLSNIIINEIPKLIDNLNCKVQIIVTDLFETLFSSSTISNNKKDKDLKDFHENEKLLKEIVDDLIHNSGEHFVIVTYNNIDNLIKSTITSKFKNVVEMDKVANIIKENKRHKYTKLQMKIESITYSHLESYIN